MTNLYAIPTQSQFENFVENDCLLFEANSYEEYVQELKNRYWIVCPCCGTEGIKPEFLGDIQGVGWSTETLTNGEKIVVCEECVVNGNVYEKFDIQEDN